MVLAQNKLNQHHDSSWWLKKNSEFALTASAVLKVI